MQGHDSIKEKACCNSMSLASEWSTCWFVDSISYLGLTISADLSWSKHIQTITSKARQLVGLLFQQFYKHASTNTIRKLYLTIARPHLEYVCEIWDPYLAKNCQMIESVQNFASRVCLKQWPRNTRYQDMFEFLNMPSLAACRRQRKLCALHKIVNNLSEYPYPQKSLLPLSFCTLFVFCTFLCTY